MNISFSKLYLVVLVLSFVSCKSAKQKNSISNSFEGYISYEKATPLSRVDTKMFRLINDTKYKLQLETQNVKVSFFKDTIVLEGPFVSKILIPRLYKVHVISKLDEDSFSENVIGGNINNRKWLEKVPYKIEHYKNIKKTILDKECYLIRITKEIPAGKSFLLFEYEVFVDREFNIPFLNYPFLELVRKIHLEGLILEARIYDSRLVDDPLEISEKVLIDHYIATKIKEGGQDKKIIKNVLELVH